MDDARQRRRSKSGRTHREIAAEPTKTNGTLKEHGSKRHVEQGVSGARLARAGPGRSKHVPADTTELNHSIYKTTAEDERMGSQHGKIHHPAPHRQQRQGRSLNQQQETATARTNG